jgi:hypothetical protein
MFLTIFFADLGAIEHGVSQGSVQGPLLFIMYKYDLPPRINMLSEPVIFADDSIIISDQGFDDLS